MNLRIPSTLLCMLLVAPLVAAWQDDGTGGASPAIAVRPTLDDFVGRLNARTGNDLALSRQLVDHLADDPDALLAVPQVLRAGDATDDAARTLVHALERVGSPAAQHVLGSIFADRQQRTLDRLRAVVAAGGVVAPTSDTIDTLWSVAQQRTTPDDVDVSNTALLALGVAGCTLRDGASKGWVAVRSSLLTGLATSAEPLERCMLLKGLGNLHDPDVGGDVSAYLFDASASVRASAAEALGRMGADAERSVLAGQLASEPRGAVRAAMVGGLRELGADAPTLDSVLQAILVEANPEARAQMTLYLGEHLDALAGIRETLEQVMRNDPSNRIRILAADALSS